MGRKTATCGSAGAKQKSDDKVENGEQTVKANVQLIQSSSDSSNSNGSGYDVTATNSKAVPKQTPHHPTPTYDINQRPRRQIKHKYITDRRPTIVEIIKPIQTSSEKDVMLISVTADTPVLPILLEPQSTAPVKRKRGRPRTVRPLSIDVFEPQINSNDSSINQPESKDNTDHSNSSDNILQLVEIIKEDADTENDITVELSADDSSSKPYELLYVVDSSSQSQDLQNATNADDIQPERSVSPASLNGITIDRHSKDTYIVTMNSGNDGNPKKQLNDNKIYVEVSGNLDRQEIVEVKEMIYDSGSQNSSGDVYGFEEQQVVHKLQPKSFEGAFSGIRRSRRLTSVKPGNYTMEEEKATKKIKSKSVCKEIIEIPELTATDSVSLAVLQLHQLESSTATDSSKAKKSKKIQPAIRSKRINRRHTLVPAGTLRSLIPSKNPSVMTETPVLSETLPEESSMTTEDSQFDATPVSVETENLVEITSPEPIQDRTVPVVDKLKITPPRSSSLKLQAQISTTFDILLKKTRPENGLCLSKPIECSSKSIASSEKPDILPLPSVENLDKVENISVSRSSSPVKLKKTPKCTDGPLNVLPELNLSLEDPDNTITSSIIALPSPSVVNRDKNERIPVSRSSSPVKLPSSTKRSSDSLHLPPIKSSKIDFSQELDKLAMKDRQSISRRRRTVGDFSAKKLKNMSRTLNNLELDSTLPPKDRNQMPVIDSKLSVSKITEGKRNKASHIEKALLESPTYDPIECSTVDTKNANESLSQKPSNPIVTEASTNLNPQAEVSFMNFEVPVKEANTNEAELALSLLKQLQEPVGPKTVVKTKGSLKLLVDPKISIDSHSRDSIRKDKSKSKHAKADSSSKKGLKIKSKKISSRATTDPPTELSERINIPAEESSHSYLPEVDVRKNTKLKSTRWEKIDPANEPDKLSLNNGCELDAVEHINRSSIVQQDESSYLDFRETFKSNLDAKSYEVLDGYDSSAGVLLTNGVNYEYNDSKEVQYDENEFVVNSASSPRALEEKSQQPDEEGISIRRSGRIKSISETKQRSHGYGLVKDKERFQSVLPNDITNANLQAYQYAYVAGGSLNSTHDTTDCDKDSHSNFFAAIKSRFRTQEDIEKEERDVQEGLALFEQIEENEFKTERSICREAKYMICDCFMTKHEINAGQYGCGEDCMNRMLMLECGSRCNVGGRCTNNRFQKIQNANCTIFKTDKKGFGMKAVNFIPAGDFIMEYVGEVLNSQQFEQRANEYSLDNNKHHYFMALRSDRVIDATVRGNISRFINHSCDPNAETQKWTVNGELRIGFFSIKNIYPNEEITFDYQFQRYGKEAQKCYCEAEVCRGWIGEEPETDEEYEDFQDGEECEEGETAIKPTVPDIKLPEQLAAPTLVDSSESIDIIATTDPSSIDSLLPPAHSILTGNETEIAVLEIPAPKVAQKPKKLKDTETVDSKDKGFKRHIKTKRAEIMEDPDLDMEIDTLMHTNLKNQAHTLRFSRLMVRAKLKRNRCQLLSILRNGEVACCRLFLDYHGLKLLYNWMCDEDAENDQMSELQFRLEILITLEVLPIPNKLMLQDSNVLLVVQKWATSPCASAGDISVKRSSGDSTPDCDFNEATSDKLTTAECEEALRNMPDLIEQGIDLTALKQIITTNENNEKKINNMPTIAVNEATPEESVIAEPIASLIQQIRSIASKLVTAWSALPDFRIPKKLRMEQMKEHEREANLNCSVLVFSDEMEKQNQQRYKDRYRKDGSTIKEPEKDRFRTDRNEKTSRYRVATEFNLSKLHRRQMFEAKVAEEKRRSEQERMHVCICSYFQLDPRLVHERDVPFYVDPYTGQWYARNGHMVPTPPSHIHVKPPGRRCSTNLNDYKLPPMDLPEFWKCAINEQGYLYYYHVKIGIPQWQPPIKLLPLASEAAAATRKKPDIVHTRNKSAYHGSDREDEADSSDNDDPSVSTLFEQLANMYAELNDKKNNPYYILKTPPNLSDEISAMADASTSRSSSLDVIKPVDLSATLEGAQQLIPQKYMAKRIGLVDVRMMSPRTEKERMEMKDEMRRNKEKVRRRKEEARRKKHALVPSVSSLEPSRKLTKLTEGLPVIPLDDEMEASTAAPADDSFTTMTAMLDEEIAQLVDDDANFAVNPIHFMKNVDELDVLRKNKSLLKTLRACSPEPTLELSPPIPKRKKIVETPSTHLNSEDSKRIKDKFRSDIAGVIVQHLGPYRREDCKIGRISNTDDFKHLAKKLTQYVMQKELKYCNTVHALEVTESVKVKSKEFIKKYMSKYDPVYVKPENEPEYKDFFA